MSEIAYTERLKEIAENGPLFQDNDEEDVERKDDYDFVNVLTASTLNLNK